MNSKHRLIPIAVLALGLSIAVGSGSAAARTAAKTAKAPLAAPQPMLVDINSAGKEELKKLPNVGDAEADRIIAGRPYLTKAHLQTHNVVSPAVYLGLREHVVARQKDAKFVGKAAK